MDNNVRSFEKRKVKFVSHIINVKYIPKKEKI